MIEGQRLNLLKHVRPIHLVTTVALYLLGIGFARYLGQSIDYSLFLLGLAWLLLLQLGYYFLGDHFKTPFDAVFSNAVLHWVKESEEALQKDAGK